MGWSNIPKWGLCCPQNPKGYTKWCPSFGCRKGQMQQLTLHLRRNMLTSPTPLDSEKFHWGRRSLNFFSHLLICKCVTNKSREVTISCWPGPWSDKLETQESWQHNSSLRLEAWEPDYWQGRLGSNPNPKTWLPRELMLWILVQGFLLFLSDFQWIGWGSSILDRVICFTQSTISSVHCI